MINATVKESVSLPMTALDETGVFCWNRIGVQGDRSCGRLVEVVHCHNCPIFSNAGRMLFDRAPPEEVLVERTSQTAIRTDRTMEQLNSGLLFRLGEEWLVIDAMSTIEVAELRPIRRIPRRTDAIFLGMVNIRGELRLAFDLHQLLGIAPLQGAERQAGRFVVIRLDRQTWVFPTDEVSAIIRYRHSQETAVPSTLKRWKSALVRSVIEWEKKKAGRIDSIELLARLNKHMG